MIPKGTAHQVSYLFSHERQVKVIIDKHQVEAIRARSARLARGNQSGLIAIVAMSLRASITAMATIIRVSLRQKPAAHREPAVSPESMAYPDAGTELVDTAVVA